MFRVSQRPSSGALKTVTAASGTGHNTGTATSLQRVTCIDGTNNLLWLTALHISCFSCSPPDLNLAVTNFMFFLHVK